MRRSDPVPPGAGEPVGVEVHPLDAGPSEARPVRLLLVEDDARFADLVRYVLSEANPAFEVNHVRRLSSALACLVRQPIDVILTDLQLPDSSGSATVRYLRRAAHDTPLVVLSSNTDPEVALQSISEGADEYVVKGTLGLNALGSLILLALDRRREPGGESPPPRISLEDAAGSSTLESIARQLLRVADRVGLHIGFLSVRVDGPATGLESEQFNITELADFLRTTLRRYDLVARAGPNELAVVLVMQQPDVHNAVSRLAQAMVAVDLAERAPVRMGVATYHPGGPESLEELVAQAQLDLRPVHA
jgi:DNA-binding response OmpR family regulator